MASKLLRPRILLFLVFASSFLACGEDDSGPTSPGNPSNPLTVTIDYPAVLVPDVPALLTVTATTTEDLGELRFDIDVDDGDIDDDSVVIDGNVYTAMVSSDGYDNSMTIEAVVWPAQSNSEEDEVVATLQVLRADEIEVLERYVDSYAESNFYAQNPSNNVLEWSYKDNAVESTEDIGAFASTLEAEGSGVAQGMTASSQAEATVNSEFSIDAEGVLRTSFTATASGSASLSNPHDLAYGAWADAGGDTNVEFYVWGTGAEFTLQFNVPLGAGVESRVELEVDPFGEEDDYTLCLWNGEPCPQDVDLPEGLTLQRRFRADGSLQEITGRLPAGEYEFDLYAGGEVRFSSNDRDPAAGSGRFDLNVSSSLEVTPGR